MTVTLREYFDAACVLHETIRQIKSAGFLLNPDGYTAPAMELIGNTELKDIDAGYADAERALDEACKFSNLKDQRLYQIQELVAECLRFGDKTHG